MVVVVVVVVDDDDDVVVAVGVVVVVYAEVDRTWTHWPRPNSATHMPGCFHGNFEIVALFP